MEVEYVRLQKSVGTTHFFEKSYKNTRTITDTVIDTIVSVTASAFSCHFYGKWGAFLNFATHFLIAVSMMPRFALVRFPLITTYFGFISLNNRYSLYNR